MGSSTEAELRNGEDKKEAEMDHKEPEGGDTVDGAEETEKKRDMSITNGGKESVQHTESDGQKKKKDEIRTVSLLRLYMFADSLDYLLLFMATIGAIVHGVALPLFFFFFGKLINGFGEYKNDPQKMADVVGQYALYFVYVGIAIFLSSWAEIACWMHSGERQTARLRIKYLEAILRQDVGFFDTDGQTGILIDSISRDTLQVQDAISEKMGNFIHHMATFVGGIAVGLSSSWRLVLVTLAAIPAIGFAGGLYAYTLTRLTSKGQQAYGEAGSIAEEAIAQIRTVHSFVGEARSSQAYSQALKSTLKLGYRGGLAKGLGMGVSYGLLFCSWALVLWYAGILVRRGDTNGGKAISAIFAIIIGGISLGQAFSTLTALAKGRAAGYKIMEMINKQPKMNRNVSDGSKLPEVKGNIELCNVDFSYPSRPDVPIFKDFSLQIMSGKTVAIVGSSGSGKSTVVSLIERFYDPLAGQVLLDGVDIRTLHLKWLRDQLGLVNQEPSLFATNILENVLYGKEDANLQDVEEAAKAANAHGFISQLPEGYKTQVGERGVQLSGGQKQRVAIARAMLKNPRILLLDEATSALDAASESVVQEALDRLMVGRTTVVIAHRLSTIRNVDTIAVVQGGKIVEIGSHDELIVKGDSGVYSCLVKLQEMAMSSDGTILSRDSRHGSSMGRLSNSKSGRRSFSHHSASGRRISHHSSGSEAKIDFDIQKVEIGEETVVAPPQGTFWKLAKLNAPEWPYALLGSLGSVLCGCINPIFAIVISQLLTTFYDSDQEKMKKDVQKYSLVFVGAAVASCGFYVLQHYFFGIMGENLTNRVREMMLASILKNEVGWFDREENTSTRLATRLAIDATNVRAAIGDRISLIVQNLTLFIIACIISFVVQWRMALVVMATFPMLVAAAVAENLFMKGFSGDLAEAHSRASMISGEAVGNIRTVAAFNAEDKVVQLFAGELKGPERRSLMRGNVAGFFYGIAQFAMYASYGLTLWYGSTLVKNHTSGFGPVVKVFLMLMITAFAVAETLSLTPDFVKGGTALLSVFSILDRESLIEPDDPDAEKLDSVKGDIEFRQVDFAYPARPEVCIFKDFDLKVRAGESLALVGASGSGKSSVIALIERFYDPQAGRVMVDGIDVRKANLKTLRRHIGLVQQEPALFATSIYENILYGREGASEGEVEEAARAANAHTFISSLPEGYGTKVGDRGVQLSGGQKQRVAIARGVLKDPAILLLDEATSALDAESEKVVQEALDRLMTGRTTVLIAHRLSTIRNAASIAVVQEGRIIEEGTHHDLIAKADGAYARLVNIQAARYRSQPDHHSSSAG